MRWTTRKNFLTASSATHGFILRALTPAGSLHSSLPWEQSEGPAPAASVVQVVRRLHGQVLHIGRHRLRHLRGSSCGGASRAAIPGTQQGSRWCVVTRNTGPSRSCRLRCGRGQRHCSGSSSFRWRFRNAVHTYDGSGLGLALLTVALQPGLHGGYLLAKARSGCDVRPRPWCLSESVGRRAF